MFFNHNKEPTISLYKKRINWVLLSRLLKWILSIICLVALCEMLFNFSLSTLVNGIWWCLIWYLSISLVRWCKKHFKYHRLLHYFLKANKLYTEVVQDGKSYITSSAILSWKETNNKIIILAYKVGDAYSKRLETLDTELSALLNLPLEAKIIQPSVVEYHFYTTRPTRLKHATPHKLRHTGATLAKQAGMSLEAISEALTHSDTITTKTYVNTSNVVPITAGQVAYEHLTHK